MLNKLGRKQQVKHQKTLISEHYISIKKKSYSFTVFVQIDWDYKLIYHWWTGPRARKDWQGKATDANLMVGEGEMVLMALGLWSNNLALCTMDLSISTN